MLAEYRHQIIYAKVNARIASREHIHLHRCNHKSQEWRRDDVLQIADVVGGCPYRCVDVHGEKRTGGNRTMGERPTWYFKFPAHRSGIGYDVHVQLDIRNPKEDGPTEMGTKMGTRMGTDEQKDTSRKWNLQAVLISPLLLMDSDCIFLAIGLRRN